MPLCRYELNFVDGDPLLPSLTLNTKFWSGLLKAGVVLRPKREWENNTKTYTKEVTCEGMDWIDFGQGMERKLFLVKSAIQLWFL
jgi:hypothetical protein